MAHQETTLTNIPNAAMSNKPQWKRIFIKSKLPEKLQGLYRLSRNLWWSWHHDAIELFRSIHPQQWEKLEHNPIAMIDSLTFEQMDILQASATFMASLDKVSQQFDNYMAQAVAKKAPKIAYFCMEYGLHTSIKLYSGGLGVLAGDYLKEASDSNSDMVAVGLMYRYGYFDQVLSINGEQISEYPPQRLTQLPLLPVRDEQDNWLKVTVPLPGRTLHAKVWELNVGRISLYLLDTEVPENSHYDKSISHYLYGGEREYRIQQEMLLGIGGSRMLDTLGIRADIYHLNEGHAAFLGLERLRKCVQDHRLSFDEAVEVVRSSSLFTTHTPVPAGHDYFSEDLLRTYTAKYADWLGISWAKLVSLGRINGYDAHEQFSMSHLAARLSQEINGVSRLHGAVSRDMFNPLWEGYTADELHLGYVTNGVHYPTWIANSWHQLYVKHFGEAFFNDQSNKGYWRKIHDVADVDIHNMRQHLKQSLITALKSKLQNDLTKKWNNPSQLFKMLNALNPKALFVGFARRFATYKRATLLFQNLERLAALVNHPDKPVVLLFAGKAHPADKGGQALIRRIVEISKMPQFLGKIIFLENYNMDIARFLVQGVDIWLNTPTRPKEASGTSGMKAALNGVLNLSVLDGWWAEGYRADAGWALSEERTFEQQDFQNQLDAETIYNILENEVVPEFFERNEEDIAEKWIQRIKNNIAEIAPQFTMKRQLEDYYQKFYYKLYERSRLMQSNSFAAARNTAAWKRKVNDGWNGIEVIAMDVFDSANRALPQGDYFDANITLHLNGLSVDDIGLEVVFVQKKGDEHFKIIRADELQLISQNNGFATYQCHIQANQSGVYEYGFRLFPKNGMLPHKQDFGLVKWI